MTLEILLSCMHQSDDALVYASKLTGNCVLVNQCNKNGYREYRTQNGIARMFSTTQRGLTKSRNMAIEKSVADICLLCDDDECFVENYEQKILDAYQSLPQADVIVFKMIGRKPSFKDKAIRLKFPKTLKVSSVQISFRRKRLIETGVRFDELLGAGSGNGAEEELKFLIDCQKSRLSIWYVPVEIASVAQQSSTWFEGFNEEFFEKRGATTRYILGWILASLYAVYYVVKKRGMYQNQITPQNALKAIFRGIQKNNIGKQRYKK